MSRGKKLAASDRKNMETIIRTVFGYRPKKKLEAPKHKPSKKEMEKVYRYEAETNTFREIS